MTVKSGNVSPKSSLPIAGSAPERSSATADDHARGSRLAEEFRRVDMVLHDCNIMSTVVVFGSSRVHPLASDKGAQCLDPAHQSQAEWYEMARDFAKIVSQRGGAIGAPGSGLHNVIATGGGPGLMEAANRGAAEAGAPSIGFNIVLPVEQPSNPFTTPELTFHFHYFAMRKMHLAMRANALAVFPGGFGTLDELFELLTLKQTGKGQQIPIVLFDRSYWQKVINFDALVELGMISKTDIDLFEFVDSSEQAWNSLVRRGLVLGTPRR
jgi:uncharacterized protein (TIGR00730 family)